MLNECQIKVRTMPIIKCTSHLHTHIKKVSFQLIIFFPIFNYLSKNVCTDHKIQSEYHRKISAVLLWLFLQSTVGKTYFSVLKKI